LILRYFDAIDQHRGLAGLGREKYAGPLSAGYYLHKPRQILLKAAHEQPVQVDRERG
jgi:hypothetical protein